MNDKYLSLSGNNLGYVPLLNLFSEEELQEINPLDLFLIIDDLNQDGLAIKEIIYSDGSKELKCYIK